MRISTKISREAMRSLACDAIACEVQYQAIVAKDKKITVIEKFMAGVLDARGISYEREKSIGKYRVDFFIFATNTVLEVQGCYWYGCLQCGYNNVVHQGRRKKDEKRNEFLRACGYDVNVIWQHDLKRAMQLFRREKQYQRGDERTSFAMLVQYEREQGISLERRPDN